jgi:hypothetical protein
MDANPALERAAQAATSADAARILREAGWLPDYAAETAAILFGESTGDVIEEPAPADAS